MERKVIFLAGGCFWGVEKYFSNIPGVLKTETGYANGKTENPTYINVCHDDSGHAETIRVEYDPAKMSLKGLLDMFYRVIDPTSINRQGNDVGSQYRTGIYYTDPEDLPIIQESIAKLQREYEEKIVIEVEPLINYATAEEHHQQYLDKNPGGYCHIHPGHFEAAKEAVDLYQQYPAPDREALKTKLSPLQYEVTVNKGTETPYQNEYWNHFEDGIYVDITTGEPLFSSRDKFDSCGWPSFSRTIDPYRVTIETDLSEGMVREEVRSKGGDIHLGHIFGDGPKELGGLRYCINSAALRFVPKSKLEEEGYERYLHLFE